jgi:lactoylglutathione lyase
MVERAFPVIYAARVSECAAFYEALGFARHFQLPPDGEPGYIGLRRENAELAVVSTDWPRQQYDLEPGERPRFEMFIYVDDVDGTVATLRPRGIRLLREPIDMPWGERVAYVADPEGNPVALAQGTP